MNRLVLAFTMLLLSVGMQAQLKVFEKYSQKDDVNTASYGKKSIENLPLDHFGVPGLAQMASKIEMMRVLSTVGLAAGKKIGTKMEGELEKDGYKKVLSTKKDGKDVTVMQYKKDPNHLAFIVYDKPQATAVYMRGDFAGIEKMKIK